MFGGKEPVRDPELLFQRNVVSHGGVLLSYFLRRVARREDAADLVSEVFLTAWRRIEDVPLEVEDARRWLYSLARGVLSNYRRGEVRRRDLSERLRSVLREPVLTIEDPVDDLRALLSGLSEQDQELLVLVYGDGLTLKEAAAVLGIRPATARKRAERARARAAANHQQAHRPAERGRVHIGATLAVKKKT